MKITVAPASTRTGAAVVRWLLTVESRSVHVDGLYRNLDKVPSDFDRHHEFKATQADVSDASTLDFSGSDVVLAITPPIYDGRDIAAHADLVSRNVRSAAEQAGTVRRLVLLSSVGAHLSEGVGEIKTNHIAEQIFAAANIPEIIFVRCTYFMENWTMDVRTLKEPKPYFYTTITPLDMKVPMVAINDIGCAIATEIVKDTPPTAKPHIIELRGPEDYSSLDVQQAFSDVLKKQVDVKAVEKEGLDEFFGAIFPPSVAKDWTEMTLAFLPGGILYKNPPTDEVVRGETTLDEAIAIVNTEASI
ncbi:hypothetical protein BGZ63DRAFT_456906 [Mariannaea sp. PMI_226]|nr:hypothetical protein BGZ63DRAFT_456906 [Mariannaea sp. PMI_226]